MGKGDQDINNAIHVINAHADGKFLKQLNKDVKVIDGIADRSKKLYDNYESAMQSIKQHVEGRPDPPDFAALEKKWYELSADAQNKIVNAIPKGRVPLQRQNYRTNVKQDPRLAEFNKQFEDTQNELQQLQKDADKNIKDWTGDYGGYIENFLNGKQWVSNLLKSNSDNKDLKEAAKLAEKVLKDYFELRDQLRKAEGVIDDTFKKVEKVDSEMKKLEK